MLFRIFTGSKGPTGQTKTIIHHSKNKYIMGAVKCIGILTSGGDAPGMNAAIRAVTRAAIYNGLGVKGIYRGYKGLVTGEIKEFKSQNVSNIIQLGGTILKTARCKEFTTPEGRQLAYDNMKKEGIDALVIIGGDGSLTGARVFAEDILSAHKCIFLACPTFAAGRIAKFMHIYAEFIDKPDVTVLTNPSVDRTLAERLESVGVKVVVCEDVHTCCAVIDDSLVWYGSISPLGYAGGGDTMLRFDDREIAAMLKDIAEHKT